MLSIQKKPNIHKFDEPQYRPISGNKHLSNIDIDNTDFENVKIDIISLKDDIINIKSEQSLIKGNMGILNDIYNKINISIIELNKRLNNHDADRVSNNYELVNNKDSESLYDIESQIDHSNELSYIADESSHNDETSGLIKPKRKYTKKIIK